MTKKINTIVYQVNVGIPDTSFSFDELYFDYDKALKVATKSSKDFKNCKVNIFRYTLFGHNLVKNHQHTELFNGEITQ